jgi:hypothetical protein
MKIKRIVKRHHFACFTVEDENGNHFLVQQSWDLEQIWNASKARGDA